MRPLRTFTGRDVDLEHLQPGDLRVADIAHALAQLSRFGGHARRFYSVAQHSLVVAARVYQLNGGRSQARAALFHDASEAYLGDVIQPLKASPAFDAYRKLEERIQAAILGQCGLSIFGGDKLIEHVDREVLYLEALQVFTPPLVIEGVPRPSWTFPVVEMPPLDAEAAFLAFDAALKDPDVPLSLDHLLPPSPALTV